MALAIQKILIKIWKLDQLIVNKDMDLKEDDEKFESFKIKLK